MPPTLWVIFSTSSASLLTCWLIFLNTSTVLFNASVWNATLSPASPAVSMVAARRSWIWLIISPIWLPAFPDCSASLRISSETTANPLPASPALAASIDAFKDKRLVCSAISLIVPMMLLIAIDSLFSSLISRMMVSVTSVVPWTFSPRFATITIPFSIAPWASWAISLISSVFSCTTLILSARPFICSRQLSVSCACWEIPLLI